ncbi:MAG: signal peptidase II, partial [Candidatus Caldatribacteriota bacterium]|nr:signal peptidase II [Candidatus Caldatribacteriota bacterium]
FKKDSKMYIPLLFILGGAIGNLIDRVRTGGKVIDFLDLRIWPVFNFADMAIVCGMFILLVHFLFYSKEEIEE